jgi:RNase P/RNase MRP subunit p30
VLKQQRLNKRAAVVTTGGEAKDEVEVPKALADAFSLFGFDQKDAKKYVKK